MLYLIDGTGPRPDKEYAIDMAGSFCNQLRKQLGERCHYMRGPSATGIEVPSLVGDMTDFIVKDFEKSAQSKIFLGGYSRGAHAARLVGWELKRRKVFVTAMFLFDCVDREPWSNSNDIRIMDKIPANVRTCYHAIRRYEPLANLLEANNKLNSRDMWDKIRSAFGLPTTDSSKRYEEARKAINKLAEHRAENPNAETKGRHSRDSVSLVKGLTNLDFYNFGNTGLEAEAPCKLVISKFEGSHGALGGVPWPDKLIPGDDKNVMPIHAWMWANLRQEGVL